MLRKTIAKEVPVKPQPMMSDMNACPSPKILMGSPSGVEGMSD